MKQGAKKKETKSLKISQAVHQRLKLYCVQNNESMTVFADSAILSRLALKPDLNKK
jgi:hypothetical protein